MKKYVLSTALLLSLSLSSMSPLFAQDAVDDGTSGYASGDETGPLAIMPLTPPDDPGSHTATLDPAMAGDYYLRGQMETGSGLRLKEDGTFTWFLVVGSLDVFAQGKWSANEGAVLLVNDPVKYASQPYRIMGSSSWADATEAEKRIGQGIATPACYSGNEEPATKSAEPLDRAIIIQLAFDPATLPSRDGKPRTKPYPLSGCSMLWIGDRNKDESQFSYEDGYFLVTPKQNEPLKSITVENPQYAGANIQELKIGLPPLKPGVHRIWLDYTRFKPRMFDRLLLARENGKLRPYFGGEPSSGVYVDPKRKEESVVNAPAEDRTE